MNILTATVGSYPRPGLFRVYLKKLEGRQKDVNARIEPGNYKKEENLRLIRECDIDKINKAL